MGGSEKGTGRFVFELVQILIVAFALSWLLRTYVVEARVIPTGSMLPTIQLQDRIIVDKFFFKHFDRIKSGDIIVFHPPEKAHATDDFIKRVVGLPGDKVEIKNNHTYVNGQQLYEPYLLDSAGENYGPVVVPQDSLLVMGDNRNHSADSREWGFLPIENVTGRTLFRYWPLGHFGALAR